MYGSTLTNGCFILQSIRITMIRECILVPSRHQKSVVFCMFNGDTNFSSKVWLWWVINEWSNYLKGKSKLRFRSYHLLFDHLCFFSFPNFIFRFHFSNGKWSVWSISFLLGTNLFYKTSKDVLWIWHYEYCKGVICAYILKVPIARTLLTEPIIQRN